MTNEIKKIRWLKRDEAEMQRLVRNFNAKITRLQKKFPDVSLPDKISRKEFREELKAGSRRDFNREKKFIKNFLKRGGEGEVIETPNNKFLEWQVEKVKLDTRRANLNKKKSLYKPDIAKGTLTEKAIRENIKPREFDINKIHDLNKFSKQVNRMGKSTYIQQRNEIYKRNYIKAIENNLGIYANDVIQIIKEIPTNTFVEFSLNNAKLGIDFTYDPQTQKVIANEIINDLKKLGYEVNKNGENEELNKLFNEYDVKMQNNTVEEIE